MESITKPTPGISSVGRQVTFTGEIGGKKTNDTSTSHQSAHSSTPEKSLHSTNSFFTQSTIPSGVHIEGLVSVLSDENIAENTPRQIGKNLVEKGTISDLLTYNEVSSVYR